MGLYRPNDNNCCLFKNGSSVAMQYNYANTTVVSRSVPTTRKDVAASLSCHKNENA